MEIGQFSLKLQQKNAKLKKKLQQKKQQLYQLIQQGLDLSQPQPHLQSPNPHPISVSNIQPLITYQMTQLAEQQSQFHSLQSRISQTLITEQLAEEHSRQMYTVLSKYEQSLDAYRSQLVEKENQVYYVGRRAECFQDQYHSCSPVCGRVREVEDEAERRMQLEAACKIFIAELNEILERNAAYEDKENEITTQELRIPQIQGPHMEKQYKKMKTLDQIQEQDCTMFMQQRKQNILKSQKPQRDLNHRHSQHTTTFPMSLTPIYSHPQQNTHQSQLLPKPPNPFPFLSSPTPLPNFSLMSKHNYQLFKIYQEKIQKEEARYQRYCEEYTHYMGVWRVVKSENKGLLERLKGIIGAKYSQHERNIQIDVVDQELSFEAVKSSHPKNNPSLKQLPQMQQILNDCHVKQANKQPNSLGFPGKQFSQHMIEYISKLTEQLTEQFIQTNILPSKSPPLDIKMSPLKDTNMNNNKNPNSQPPADVCPTLVVAPHRPFLSPKKSSPPNKINKQQNIYTELQMQKPQILLTEYSIDL